MVHRCKLTPSFLSCFQSTESPNKSPCKSLDTVLSTLFFFYLNPQFSRSYLDCHSSMLITSLSTASLKF